MKRRISYAKNEDAQRPVQAREKDRIRTAEESSCVRVPQGRRQEPETQTPPARHDRGFHQRHSPHQGHGRLLEVMLDIPCLRDSWRTIDFADEQGGIEKWHE